jgi:hypothetical protein
MAKKEKKHVSFSPAQPHMAGLALIQLDLFDEKVVAECVTPQQVN